jgi:hypothetical protein
MAAGIMSSWMTGQLESSRYMESRLNGDSRKKKEAFLLGDVLGQVMKERLSARHEQSIQLKNAWDEVLPQELSEHCRIESFSAGKLTVVVDGPGYMHELRLCKKELCNEMNARLSGMRIREIKPAIGF